MWNPLDPFDFSQFTPLDMPAFLDFFEREHSEAIAQILLGAFVDGVTGSYLKLLQADDLPDWVKTILRWRLSAQWAYQQGIPLLARLERGLPGLLGLNYPNALRLTPEDIANVPPAVREAFNRGYPFSMSWIKRLSEDARSLTADILAANRLLGRNPADAIPILERLLQRDLIGGDPTPEQMQQWLEQAQAKTLEAIAYRAKLIARTESMRMQNLGILTALSARSKHCYVMPHAGSCPECQRLIDGRVFLIETLTENLYKNFGKKKADWVPALPQHPQCRHSPMEVPWRFRESIEHYGEIPAKGILLEWYGLPGGKAAWESLGLPRQAWLTPEGTMA